MVQPVRIRARYLEGNMYLVPRPAQLPLNLSKQSPVLRRGNLRLRGLDEMQVSTEENSAGNDSEY